MNEVKKRVNRLYTGIGDILHAVIITEKYNGKVISSRIDGYFITDNDLSGKMIIYRNNPLSKRTITRKYYKMGIV